MTLKLVASNGKLNETKEKSRLSDVNEKVSRDELFEQAKLANRMGDRKRAVDLILRASIKRAVPTQNNDTITSQQGD